MKTINTISLLFIATSLSAQIGIVEKTYYDNSSKRTIKANILYPAITDSTGKFGGNRVFQGFEASLNAELNKDKKLPLIILIHGTSGNWKNLSWLGVPLVSKGAIVVAANHPGSTTGDATPASVIRMWNQSEDVSFLIDELLQSEYSNFIDTSKIIVIGSSLGGYTALALSGARLNFEQYKQFCLDHNDASSRYFLPALEVLNNNFYKKANQSHFDERVSLAIALVPGFIEVMQFDSFQNINTCALIIGAGLDENLPPITHYRPFINKFPKIWKYIEIEDATHFSFLQICKPGAMKILADENAEFACLEKGERTREEIHKEVLIKTMKFINSTLEKK